MIAMATTTFLNYIQEPLKKKFSFDLSDNNILSL